MNKKLEEGIIWIFLIFSFFAAVFFLIDSYNKINQIEEIYTFVCPNGSIVNFTAQGPEFLCGSILNPNPIFNGTSMFLMEKEK